jgi:hypothetical protein
MVFCSTLSEFENFRLCEKKNVVFNYFSLKHDIKVTRSHQNLLPTQSVIVAHTVENQDPLYYNWPVHFIKNAL